MKDKNLPMQCLETSAILGMAAILIALAEGERATAAGFAFGSVLAMFSLWTFMIAVPRLFSTRNQLAPFLLWLLTAIKLPVYAVVLILAFSALQLPPFAVFAGAALVPCVLAAYGINIGLAAKGNRPHGIGSAR